MTVQTIRMKSKHKINQKSKSYISVNTVYITTIRIYV